jgi:tRNA A37 threonylcarbamoyltransferase TsaD
VKHVFLCGGFSANEYLVKEVQNWADEEPYDVKIEKAESQ